ncbi:hypothetical protein JCM19302_1004 [Jejuia pallidilutea]|uniref:Uncharacterized protein n=1 Tax=Jejuia pallidilutea TaxID=504487 RepID=A0A090WVB0_9FLAO|nr:hypothetical protein JCM19302_1004 [Jejuia pallidilutea]
MASLSLLQDKFMVAKKTNIKSIPNGKKFLVSFMRLSFGLQRY